MATGVDVLDVASVHEAVPEISNAAASGAIYVLGRRVCGIVAP
jgi:hypothetical protein